MATWRSNVNYHKGHLWSLDDHIITFSKVKYDHKHLIKWPLGGQMSTITKVTSGPLIIILLPFPRLNMTINTSLNGHLEVKCQ